MASKLKISKLFCFTNGDVFEWSEKDQALPARCVNCEHKCKDVMEDRVRRNVLSKQLWFDFEGTK